LACCYGENAENDRNEHGDENAHPYETDWVRFDIGINDSDQQHENKKRHKPCGDQFDRQLTESHKRASVYRSEISQERQVRLQLHSSYQRKKRSLAWICEASGVCDDVARTYFSAAWAAARRAMGTRKGEQL